MTLDVVTVGDKVVKNYAWYVSAVELLFACTFEKAQGKTLSRVIMCLHQNPWRSAQLAHFYVAFTRVTTGDDLRVWPARELNLERFKKLQHSLELILLHTAYDENGVF